MHLKSIFLGGFRAFISMAEGFILECLYKEDLGNFQCPNAESDFHQPKYIIKGDQIDSYAKKYVYFMVLS